MLTKNLKGKIMYKAKSAMIFNTKLIICVWFALHVNTSHAAEINDHTGEDVTLTEVIENLLTECELAAPASSYADRLVQSLKDISEYAVHGAQQTGKILYRNRILLSAAALYTFYYVSTFGDGCEKEVNITGTCPKSFHLEDFSNQPLQGCNGLTMKLNWWSAETNGSLPSIRGIGLEELKDFLGPLNETWSTKIYVVDDYVTTAFDDVGNFFCSCLYGLKADDITGTNFVFSVMLPFVANVFGRGLNADGTVRGDLLGQGLSGTADDGMYCPAIVHGECHR